MRGPQILIGPDPHPCRVWRTSLQTGLHHFRRDYITPDGTVAPSINNNSEADRSTADSIESISTGPTRIVGDGSKNKLIYHGSKWKRKARAMKMSEIDTGNAPSTRKRDKYADMEIDETEKRSRLAGVFQTLFLDVVTLANPAEQGHRAQ